MSGGDLDQVNITDTLASALDTLDAEITTRAAQRETNPTRDFPLLALIAHADQRHQDRLSRLLARGRDVGVVGVIIGDWPTGTTVEISDDGTIHTATGPQRELLTGSRAFHLGEEDTAAVLGLLHGSHGHLGHHARTEPTATARPADPNSGASTSNPTAAVAAPVVERHESGQQDGPVRLSVLGGLLLDVAGHQINTGLRSKARELAAYLVMLPDGVPAERVVDTLLPRDRDEKAARRKIQDALGSLRSALRAATGIPNAMFVTYAGGRYRLDPHLVRVDLWMFHDALREARESATHAQTPRAARPALEKAVALYRGPLLEGCHYDWVGEYQHEVQRAAVDALAQLAELQGPDEAEQALALLDQAARFDPYNEQLYQRIMRIQHRLGRTDAISRTMHLLATRLGETGDSPTSATMNVASQLQHLDQPARAARGRSGE